MTCWRRVGLLLLLSGAGLIGRASAQTPTGAVTADAVVVTVGMTITTLRNLDFGTVRRVGPPANPNMYVWIGGTVRPAAAAKPGIYRGNVILSLVYQ